MSAGLSPEAEALFDALDRALAVAQEFDGAPIEDKLAAFGLDADAVRLVVDERYRAYLEAGRIPDTPQARETFAAAFAEGLITGRKL